MGDKEVYEYFLDGENFILSWRAWNKDKKEKYNEFKNNPDPIPQMNDAVRDENGRLWYKKTNKNFKLINHEIVILSHNKSDDEIFKNKYSITESFRRIAKGLVNNLDPEFVEWLNDINKTVRK
jgi:hypothetical protein